MINQGRQMDTRGPATPGGAGANGGARTPPAGGAAPPRGPSGRSPSYEGAAINWAMGQPGGEVLPVGWMGPYAVNGNPGPETSFDPSIEALDLSRIAKEGAYALKQAFPDVVFLSGRRTTGEQATVMAKNILEGGRAWIKATYRDSAPARKLQKWIDDNPQAQTQELIAIGLQAMLDDMSSVELRLLTAHLSGDAFDVRPQEDDADAIKAKIRQLSGLIQFLDREGGLVRWHAGNSCPSRRRLQEIAYSRSQEVSRAEGV